MKRPPLLFFAVQRKTQARAINPALAELVQAPCSLFLGCSDASWCSSGCKSVSPASGTCPVATVVISGGDAGDLSAESPDVKVPVGWAKAWSAPTGGEQVGRL